MTTRFLFHWIYNNCNYDQLIAEFEFSWVHVSYTSTPRRNVLVASALPGKSRAVYTEIGPEEIAALSL
jgi:hypothetical protein